MVTRFGAVSTLRSNAALLLMMSVFADFNRAFSRELGQLEVCTRVVVLGLKSGERGGTRGANRLES